VGHLKNADFFDTGNHGEAIFEVTSSKPNDGGGANVKGNLTIKGITKPVEGFLMVIPSKNIQNQVNIGGGFTFDRTDYGITYAGMADNLIKDEVALQVNLVSSPK